MKRLLTLLTLLTVSLGIGSAQNLTGWGQLSYDTGATVPGSCGPQPMFYIKTGPPLQLFVCNPATSVFVGIPGTLSATAGSVAVASGKTETFNNTFIFMGTDGTTITFPTTSITVPGTTAVDCGTAAGACANTNKAPTLKVVTGEATLSTGSPSTAAITGIAPTFTSTTSFQCVAQDTTTAAINISVLTAGYVSTSAVTFTGPNTNTDTFRYVCVGY